MGRINRQVPYYDRGKKRWRVEFADRAAEEGDLLYVAAEFARSGLYFPYNTSRTAGEAYSGHAHSFQGVLRALLDDLLGWNSDKQYVQRKWAKAIFSTVNPTEINEKEN